MIFLISKVCFFKIADTYKTLYFFVSVSDSVNKLFTPVSKQRGSDS